MYTHPFFEATPPGAAPGPPVKNRVPVFATSGGVKSTGQFSSGGETPLGRSQNTVQRDQHGRLATYDERERKNGDYRKIRLIELSKSFDFVPA